jgi:putative endonuclease
LKASKAKNRISPDRAKAVRHSSASVERRRTTRPEDRLQEHNAGKNPSTARFTPWLFANVIGFRSKQKSLEFERYLKGGSGRAFIRRHLL